MLHEPDEGCKFCRRHRTIPGGGGASQTGSYQNGKTGGIGITVSGNQLELSYVAGGRDSGYDLINGFTSYLLKQNSHNIPMTQQFHS